IPGVSRSGATIATGMAMGLKREEAARFAFLLGIPAILAAAGREGVALVETGMSPGEAELFLVGMVTSALVGYFTVKYFIRYLARHSLAVFAWYRLLLAGAVAAWLLIP
ncbi:MAG TPA: undecaprenyl-diphosphate phosphatase, partial [Vicinamibacterales bacterium]|nr:undecaprenyl-diphosphate phosphatase [Vicinamibacterales bacterium]